ncbi:hypothetical protein [Nitrosomonas sp.]|uniref:hypothetical protein n=1 Tax=Nitrosomonas sp. TaxID=42353 RepID=UPI00262C3813|nr:hypothetical protein [Nitrosomonas sp.]
MNLIWVGIRFKHPRQICISVNVEVNDGGSLISDLLSHEVSFRLKNAFLNSLAVIALRMRADFIQVATVPLV